MNTETSGHRMFAGTLLPPLSAIENGRGGITKRSRLVDRLTLQAITKRRPAGARSECRSDYCRTEAIWSKTSSARVKRRVASIFR